jgi:hypothetical protein
MGAGKVRCRYMVRETSTQCNRRRLAAGGRRRATGDGTGGANAAHGTRALDERVAAWCVSGHPPFRRFGKVHARDHCQVPQERHTTVTRQYQPHCTLRTKSSAEQTMPYDPPEAPRQVAF